MEILLGVAGLALTVAIYLFAKKDKKKEKHEDYLNRQMDNIISRYIGEQSHNIDNGIHALSKSGLGILESDKNVRILIQRIISMTQERQLKDFLEETAGKDLYAFFSFVSEHNIDVFKNSTSKIFVIIDTGNINEIVR